MGYSRKDEIARLRKERKEAKAAKKRQEDVRDRQVRFLIVCEGTKTEPHYFEALVTNCLSLKKVDSQQRVNNGVFTHPETVQLL